MDNKIVKVSIIVPIYNAEKYMKRCIDSIINQTIKEIEILLIDDGSKDNSGKICDEYAFKDSRIKVIHKINEGAGIARTKGLQNANGRYVGFVDSDDYIHESMYETLYKEAIKEEAQACFCGSYMIHNGEAKINQEVENIIINETEIVQESIPYICNGGGDKVRGAIAVWNGIYNLEFIRKNNIEFKSEREILSEDTIFNLSFFTNATKILFINKYLYYQVLVEQSLSRGKGDFSISEIYGFYNLIAEYIKKNEKVDKEKCLLLLDYRCIREYKIRIAKEVKYELDRNRMNQNIRKACNDKLFRELINHKHLMKVVFDFKDKIFILLAKYKVYSLLKLIFRVANYKNKIRRLINIIWTS